MTGRYYPDGRTVYLDSFDGPRFHRRFWTRRAARRCATYLNAMLARSEHLTPNPPRALRVPRR